MFGTIIQLSAELHKPRAQTDRITQPHHENSWWASASSSTHNQGDETTPTNCARPFNQQLLSWWRQIKWSHPLTAARGGAEAEKDKWRDWICCDLVRAINQCKQSDAQFSPWDNMACVWLYISDCDLVPLTTRPSSLLSILITSHYS